jgi:type II secretory pathway pseudopilin PulG
MEIVKNNIINNKGQVALIVLLVSAVALTLGLSASKKAITDTKVDKDETELKNAFNVAESSIDQYLSNGSKTYTTTDNNATANITTNDIGNETTIESDGIVLDGKNSLFWLINHDTIGSICTSSCTIYNGTDIKIDIGSFEQGLKVDYFYKNGATYGVKRYVYNFGGSSAINNATPIATSNITIPIGAVTPLLISVTPIGGNTKLTLSGGNFPIQGEEITAVGEVGSGVKTQVKTINKYNVPDFFMESVSAVNEISP